MSGVFGGRGVLCALLLVAAVTQEAPAQQLDPNDIQRTGILQGGVVTTTASLSERAAIRAASVSQPSAPLLSVPSSVVSPEDSTLAISATASSEAGGSGVTLSASGYPSFLSLSTLPGQSSAAANLAGTPGPTDSGTWQILWVATETVTGVADSAVTVLEVVDTNLPATADLPSALTASGTSPFELNVHFVDPNGDPIEEVAVGRLPAGSFFDPAPDGAGGTFLWTPQPDQSGEYPLTIRAWSRGGIATASTVVAAMPASGPRVARVSPALHRLRQRDHRSDYLVDSRHGGVPGASLFAVGNASSEALHAIGCDVGLRADSLFTIWCPLDSLGALFATPELSSLQPAGRCQASMDSALIAVHADGIRSAFPPPYSGEQGASALIGFVDSGIDASRADFVRAVGNSVSSRIYRLWDQVIGPFFQHPSPGGWPYGSEYTRQQINADGFVIGERDSTGHGTLVAGIAAGNGRGGTQCKDQGAFVGLAPEADLIVVKRRPSEVDVVNGIDYVFSKADSLQRPAVVNLSLTSHVGAHDGGSYFDQAVRQRMGPGRIIVAAAGNDGNAYNGVHASVSPRFAGVTEVLAFDILPYSIEPFNYLEISGWMDLVNSEPADSIQIEVHSPRGEVLGPVRIYEFDARNTPDGNISVCGQGDCSGTRNQSNAFEFLIRLETGEAPPYAGRWEVRVKTLRAGTGRQIDFYMVDGSFTAGWIQGGSGDRTISSPASADSVIAVGAFTSKDCWEVSPTVIQCEQYSSSLGQIASFSSHGPRRDGATKPEVTAPGAMVASVRSQFAPFATDHIVYGGGYAVERGTSLAAPIVTGTVALLLSQPDSSWASAGPSRIRARLESSAGSDASTGPVPNSTWGYGKLNVAGALAPVERLRIFHPARGQVVGPAPDSINFIVNGCTADSVVFYVAADSCRVYGHRVAKATNVAPNVATVIAFFAPDSASSPHASVRGFAFAGDSVFAATSEGFFLFTSPTGIERTGPDSGRILAMGQNFPNPFNPQTTLRLGVAHVGRMRVTIFSPSGQLIRTLADGNFSPGTYRLSWDGADARGNPVASGIYFVRASSGREVVTRKVTLLR